MTHAELFNELMRVHTEANKLVEQAVKEEREACAVICDNHDHASECAKAIRARGQA